jgi:hypothetical protein
MTMLEDFWLPRREGGRGTEITTLPGGQNLGEMDDVMYFQKKLSKALNVPVSRQEAEVNFNIGRSTEITRDEIKFQKFINRARNKFAVIFDQLIEIHLALKGVMTRAEWQIAQNSITYNFANDNHFEELKESEIMTERLRLLGEIDPLVGKYFSLSWVRKNVLRMTEDEIAVIGREIEVEKDDDEMLQFEPQATQQEELEPENPMQVTDSTNKSLSSEETALVESMTRFYNSLSAEYEEDNQDESSG